MSDTLRIGISKEGFIMFFLCIFLLVPTIYSMDLTQILNPNNEEISNIPMYNEAQKQNQGTEKFTAQCNFCSWVVQSPKKSTLKNRLNSHKIEHHANLPCKFCNQSMVTERALIRHVNSSHEIPLKAVYGNSPSGSHSIITINSVSYRLVQCGECNQVKISKKPWITHCRCTKKV